MTRYRLPAQGHLRLLLFFVGLGLFAGSLGTLGLGQAVHAGQRTLVLWSSVALVCGLGFLGVYLHRVHVLRARWRETEAYLLQIERESSKYQALLEGSADHLLVVDPERQEILELNAQARQLLALLPPKQPPGAEPVSVQVLLERLEEGDRVGFWSALAAQTGPASAAAVPLESLAVFDPLGRRRTMSARFAAIALDGRRVVLLSLRDLTAQKQIERQLQIHERLSSLGLLTAGVAHEINNPLEAIGNYLALLNRPQLGEEDRRRYVAALQFGFRRIGEIVRDMLQFARPEPERGSSDLVQVVQHALRLAGYSKKLEGLQLEVSGLETPLLVYANPGRLEQVLVNLLLNAANAANSAGRRGQIWLRAAPISEPERARSWIEIVVEDDGPGIAPEHLEHLFDPFFTTKAEGSGLGLSIAYGIVAAHGGELSASNRKGGGARFSLRLPPLSLAPEAGPQPVTQPLSLR